MKCPYCGFSQDRVVDSRESKDADSIRRRRECEGCNKRFTTYERIDEIPYMVVKKDGRREKFDRQKILSGLLHACEKRPVSAVKLDQRSGRADYDAPEGDRHRCVYPLRQRVQGLQGCSRVQAGAGRAAERKR